MPKLSIIIPVYNVESYLSRCLDSVLGQTFVDYEVLLIDDGSVDHSGEIVDKYAALDKRIISFHQENKGVSEARNLGLEKAQGEFVGFIDPDDWIDSNMYEILMYQIEANSCDIASCSWMDNDENGNERAYESNLSSQIMKKKEYFKHLFDMPPTISGSTCTKVFRRDIIMCGFDKRYVICEDNLFVAHCCSNCKKALYINKPLYHVYKRKGSATRKEPFRTALGLQARREIIEIARSVNKECGDLAESLFLDQCITFCLNSEGLNNQYRNNARDEYLSYLDKKPFCLLRNGKISVKQKLFYIEKYYELQSEKKINR